MFYKLLVPLLLIAVNFTITAYGYFSGKLPVTGKLFGIPYNGVLSSSLATQLRFVWLLIFINLVYTLAFYWGLKHYNSYFVVATLWITSVPIAALLFNTLVAKEPLNWIIVLGLALVAIGAVLVVANKELVN
jgi:drug/metabolite transporter (DMT)-like permease